MAPSGATPRSRHRTPRGSARPPQSPRTSEQPRRRALSSNKTSINRDLDSIRARRAKLEALTASIRLPPLIPSDIMGAYSSSILTHAQPRAFAGPRQRLHRLRKGEHPISPGDSARPSTSKLPPLASRLMTPLHTPLPKIGQLQEADEGGTGEDTKATSLTLLSSPSPDPQPPLPTPSPIISPMSQMSREVSPGSAKRSTHHGTSDITKRSATANGEDSVSSQQEEDKTDYHQIVRNMRGGKTSDEPTDDFTANDTTGATTNDTTGATTNDIEADDDATAAVKLQATIQARKLLSMEEKPPIDKFIDAGVLEAARENLNKSCSDELKFEIAWMVTNIASGNSQQTQAVTEAGLIEPLVHMVESGGAELKEQAIWALSNIAGDGEEPRNIVLEAGFIRPLVEFIRNHTKVSSLLYSTWALSNIFRESNWKLSEEDITLVLNVLRDVCLVSDNSEVMTDALYCTSFITKQENEHIQRVVNANFLPLVVPHLNTQTTSIQTAALRTVGNVVTGTDGQTNAALEAGILPFVHNILKDSLKTSLRKEAAWIMSNITAGTPAQIDRVVDEGVLPTLMEVLDQDSLDVVKEAAWAVSNMVVSGTNAQRKYVVDIGVVPRLLALMTRYPQESDILYQVVDALETLMERSDNIDEILTQMEDVDGTDTLIELRHNNNNRIVSKVKKILLTHYPGITIEEEDWGDSKGEQADNNSLSETASKYVAEGTA